MSGLTDKGPVIAFFDVDGTLVCRDPVTGPGDFPTGRVARALEAFAGRGGIPILSTGRARVGIDRLLDNLPFRGYVSLDGTHVVLDGKVILDRCFPADVLEHTVNEMIRIGMPAFFEGTELCLELNASGESLYNWGSVARDLEEMRAAKPDLRFAKVDFADEAYDAYRRSDFLMTELGYYNVGEGCHELVLPDVSKGAGARALIDELMLQLGMAPARVFAFGDSENDLSLFEAVDVSAAMGQAAPHVQDVADYIAAPCAEDGVAQAMEHFGLV